LTPTADVPVSFTPALRASDPLANYWIAQVSLRLRREITWMRHQRGLSPDGEPGALPPHVDEVQHTLDLSRFWSAKQAFFNEDSTAQYLTTQIARPAPEADSPTTGSFAWVCHELDLDALSRFTLALGLASAFDSTLGSIVSACLNDPAATAPNMGLVQRLWDEPSAALRMAAGDSLLFRYGLMQPDSSPSDDRIAWTKPFYVPPLIARYLLLDAQLPAGTTLLNATPQATKRTDILAARLAAHRETPLQVVPVFGRRGAAMGEVVAGVARALKRPVLKSAGLMETHRAGIGPIAVLCWLHGGDLFLDAESVETLLDNHDLLQLEAFPPVSLPITLYLGITEQSWVSALPETVCTPTIQVPALGYADRVAYWRRALGERAGEAEKSVWELSRRFRYEKRTIDRLSAELLKLPAPLSLERIAEACRAEVDLDIGELAQPVIPRFKGENLVLPRPQKRQFDELARAVQTLTDVHYNWGTADAWNEAGITALFAGPSGTGKTMAAELLARRLDLPMYRVDLSQVVNKYIGETEKNLRRLFDAADTSDVLLFFDEADAIFGRRTEVKDAHDRYANLEVSYLLERMERLKGVAILASNRKKDLDEAFTRRLHFVIDFPLPDVPQREVIWRQVIPDEVDTSEVDFAFLARQFQLTGGHIRSIVFQACLQRAALDSNGRHVLHMDDLIVAVKRELDKIGRPLTLHHFGPYSDLVESIGTAP